MKRLFLLSLHVLLSLSSIAQGPIGQWHSSNGSVTIGRPGDGEEGTPGAYDPDALAFYSAAGITASDQKTAISDFVTSLKVKGIWPKIDLCYPFVGGTNVSHSFNIKNPSQYTLTYTGSPVHSNLGLDFNSSGHAYTGFVPTTNDISLGIYVNSSAGSGMGGEIGQVIDTDIGAGMALVTNYYNYFSYFTVTAFGTLGTPPNFIGWFEALWRPGQYARVSKDGVLVSQQEHAANPTPTPTQFILGRGFDDYPSDKRIGLALIAHSLTDADALELNTIVHALQTALGR